MKFRTALLPLLSAIACLQVPTSGWAAGPSFNCAKAKSPAEKAICADRELAKADAAIAARLNVIGKAVDSHTGELLGKDQRYFIHVRDQIAERAASPAERVKDLRAMMTERVKFLDSVDTSTGDSMVGDWRSFDGMVTVEQAGDGTLKASIDAAEPIQGNWVCQADGSGKLNQDALDFAVEGGEAGERITLTRAGTAPVLGVDFTRDGRQDVTASFCGLNGSVAGFYFKVRKGS
ncbi:lysozyme inhibitor LprI family protein [Labrys neptuniae]